MKYVTLSARINAEDKKRFEFFCENTGLNTSVAINLFIKTVLRENRLPFSIIGDPFYSESNMKALKTSMKEEKKGKIVLKSMKDLVEMEEDE